MSSLVLLDTGPLVAILDKRDEQHVWATSIAARFPPPWQTCEAVLSEACFLTHALPDARGGILEMLKQRLLTIGLRLDQDAERIAILMNDYANVPMSLADACLVRMSELVADCVVLTLDSDFRIYRRHRRKSIPLLMPPPHA